MDSSTRVVVNTGIQYVRTSGTSGYNALYLKSCT